MSTARAVDRRTYLHRKQCGAKGSALSRCRCSDSIRGWTCEKLRYDRPEPWAPENPEHL